MTKEDVLQKVNDYCSEKSYTSETLTDEFKEKFSNFFAKKYPDDTSVDSDGIVDEIKFNLNTAFSAASKGITAKQKTFEEKETEYKDKIAELSKKASATTGKEQKVDDEATKKLEEKLARLEQFEVEHRKTEMFKEVVSLAKKNVRQDLHKSLENYAADFAVTLDDDAKEQAKKLTDRFQAIFKDSIGDIKPMMPKQTQRQEEEFIASVKKVTI